VNKSLALDPNEQVRKKLGATEARPVPETLTKIWRDDFKKHYTREEARARSCPNCASG